MAHCNDVASLTTHAQKTTNQHDGRNRVLTALNEPRFTTFTDVFQFWRTLTSATLRKSLLLDHLAVFNWLRSKLWLISSKMMPHCPRQGMDRYRSMVQGHCWEGSADRLAQALSSLEPSPDILLQNLKWPRSTLSSQRQTPSLPVSSGPSSALHCHGWQDN